MNLPHLASRLYGTPLLLARAKLDVILSVLGERVNWPESDLAAPSLPKRPVIDTPVGIALIPVVGSLVRRTVGLDPASGFTSYAEIAGMVDAALADPSVEGIVLDIDSPGGTVNGTPELAEAVADASRQKFVYAFSAGLMCSAAYWVGDGAAALWQPEQNALCLLGSTDSGVYSGETRFLTAEEVHAEQLAQRISIKLSNLPPVLMLMTDGVSDPKFDTEANLAKPEYWQQLWQELQAPLDEADPAQALQTWLDFWSAGNHDDRTIALFIPHITETHHHTTHTETENT